jgi:hypothetical protein
MGRGCVEPHPVTAVNHLARSNGHHLLGTSSGEELELDHRRDRWWQNGEYRLHMLDRYRGYLLCLTGGTLTPAQTSDTPEPVVRRRRQDLLLDRPAVHPLHSINVLVDRLPGPATVDQRLTDILQSPWPKVSGRGRTVQTADGTKGLSDAADLAGRLTVLDVPNLGVAEVRQYEFVDAHRLWGGGSGCRQHPVVPRPLGDEPGVQLVTFGGLPRTEIVVAAVNRNDGTISGLVKSVEGLFSRLNHEYGSESGPETVHVPSCIRVSSRTPDHREVH